MEVQVLFYGLLRGLTDQSEVVISLPEGASLQNLIDHLGTEFGGQLRENLQPDSQGNFPLMIAVEGNDYRFAGGLNARLADKTSVYFIPPAAGGS